MKAEKLRPSILEHIEQSEIKLTQGISEEDVMTCKKVLCQMHGNLVKMNEEKIKEEKDEQKDV